MFYNCFMYINTRLNMKVTQVHNACTTFGCKAPIERFLELSKITNCKKKLTKT